MDVVLKIVIIGAGRYGFSKSLIMDFLSYSELREGIISLVDIDRESLDLTATSAKKLVTQNEFKTRIEATTNRREALENADYVVISIEVGGFEARKLDLEIPSKYGVSQAVGDTIGPGGVFSALRHIPVLLDICHDMEDVCPEAWLLNHTNPMAMSCWAINDCTKIKNVGLCHSVQGTAGNLARYLDASIDEIAYWVAGINHMAWFLELKWRGEDAYPLLRERFGDPNVYSRPDSSSWQNQDIVRVEMFKAFGYFCTESSQHIAEYVPYFRKRPELFRKFRLIETKEKIDLWKRVQEQMEREKEQAKQVLSDNKELPIRRSREYSSHIIHSIETGTPRTINANVENEGLIDNLTNGCCVEVPCLVDRSGIHPCHIGELPPQCAALNQTNVNVQELGTAGAVEKDKTLVFQAILLDPLTSAVLTIDETKEMVDEMFEAEKKYLTGFE